MAQVRNPAVPGLHRLMEPGRNPIAPHRQGQDRCEVGIKGIEIPIALESAELERKRSSPPPLQAAGSMTVSSMNYSIRLSVRSLPGRVKPLPLGNSNSRESDPSMLFSSSERFPSYTTVPPARGMVTVTAEPSTVDVVVSPTVRLAVSPAGPVAAISCN